PATRRARFCWLAYRRGLASSLLPAACTQIPSLISPPPLPANRRRQEGTGGMPSLDRLPGSYSNQVTRPRPYSAGISSTGPRNPGAACILFRALPAENALHSWWTIHLIRMRLASTPVLHRTVGSL